MILWALFLASFAILAKSSIHESCRREGFGGGVMVVCVWLFISWVIMGWVRANSYCFYCVDCFSDEVVGRLV